MAPKLLIFDFDGVVADSETLACAIAAAYATDLGAPTRADEGLALFMGKRVEDVATLVRERGGHPPDDFAQQLLARTLAAFATELRPVEGVEAFLDLHRDISRCIASSSSHVRLESSLRTIGLAEDFQGRVFSVEDVRRGKPFPDLFLHAARAMGADPADCMVIEDSAGGVKAGVAAGMGVVGLLAGSHIGAGHDDVLREAGADWVVQDYEELSRLLAAGRHGIPAS